MPADENEKKIAQLENDVACLMRFKGEMTQKFDGRKPAEETYRILKTLGENMVKITEEAGHNKEEIQELKRENTRQHENLGKEFRDGIKSVGDKIDSFLLTQAKEKADDKLVFDSKYASDKDFQIWKWIVIIGMFLSVAMGVAGLFLQKYFHD